MAEREGCSRTTGDAPEPPPAGPGGPSTPPAGTPTPETYTALLAELGALLDGHEPHKVVVLLRAELERRELLAYSHGWRDAAAHYESAVEAARTASRRPLRLVESTRTPGQAAVIPFRQEGRGGDVREPDGRHGRDDPARGGASRADGSGERGRPADGEPRHDRPEADGQTDPPSRPPRTGAGPEPALVRKSRSSRVPTIPTLPPPRLRRSKEGGRAATPDDVTR
ncbi:hypothetical protein [Streptomyces sp. SM11]|uniref:hypothetical protein n=1 Tax=Streptomyces sp. SM11 TaxID=565557 RepID=UPI000CD54C38|nr:hypothetical protein [Streptomyces sp. SM11]